MRHADHHRTAIEALHAEEAPADSPRVRHIAIGVLLAIAGIAGIWATVAHQSHTRGWAAVIALISLVGAIITWLAAMSLTLSKSGRDPQDRSALGGPHP